MLTTVHDDSRYSHIKAELTRADDDNFGHFIQVTLFLSRFSGELLTGTELKVLFFILGRTLAFKKRAETIAFRHFVEGVDHRDERVCSGVGASENTIRTALSGLVDKKCIEVHSFVAGNVESLWRIYEVKVGQLLEMTVMQRTEKVGKRARKVVADPLPKRNTPPSLKVVPISKEKVIVKQSTSVDCSVRLPAPRNGRKPAIEINCKRETPEELVARIAGKATATRTARVKANTTVPRVKWKTTELQALLDQARAIAEERGYRTPRMVVVSKSIGVLHKRMLAAEIADPIDFFAWALQNWSGVASANLRSKARQAKEQQTVTAGMSLSPSFNDLAYRAPYFIVIYNDRAQAGLDQERVVKQAAEKSEAVRSASAAGLQQRKEAARKRDLEREEQRTREAAPRVRRRTPATFDNDEPIPEFKERVWNGK